MPEDCDDDRDDESAVDDTDAEVPERRDAEGVKLGSFPAEACDVPALDDAEDAEDDEYDGRRLAPPAGVKLGGVLDAPALSFPSTIVPLQFAISLQSFYTSSRPGGVDG